MTSLARSAVFFFTCPSLALSTMPLARSTLLPTPLLALSISLPSIFSNDSLPRPLPIPAKLIWSGFSINDRNFVTFSVASVIMELNLFKPSSLILGVISNSPSAFIPSLSLSLNLSLTLSSPFSAPDNLMCGSISILGLIVARTSFNLSSCFWTSLLTSWILPSSTLISISSVFDVAKISPPILVSALYTNSVVYLLALKGF